MKALSCWSPMRPWCLGLAALAAVFASGCDTLVPKAEPPPAFFALEGPPATSGGVASRSSAMAGPTLVVDPPRAAAGFDSARIIYVRKTHQLEYFANSEWVEAPARMLGPLIAAAALGSGGFRAVVLAPSAAAGDLRLDTELLRLQHEFGPQPSRVRLTLRATLSDSVTRQVLAQREFDQTVPAPSEDAYGGVLAANLAGRAMLLELAAFCADSAKAGTPPRAGADAARR